MGEIAYLPERTGHPGLPTRNEDTRSNDRIERLPSQQLLLVRAFVQLFRNVADSLWEGELVAPAGDVAEGSEDVSFRTRALRA